MNIGVQLTFNIGNQKVTKITVVTFRHKMKVKATSYRGNFLVRGDQKVTKIRRQSDQNFCSGRIKKILCQ